MKSKNGNLSQMIWACFVGNTLGPIVFISDSINQDVYLELLRTEFDPFLNALAAYGQTNLEFQQDNACPHTAKRTLKFLEAFARKHGLTIIDWPANSPDLSLIETSKTSSVFKQYPDTATLKGSARTIKVMLQQRLHKIWWDIGEEVLNRLVEDMPKHCKKVIAARGWYTGH